MSKIIKNTILYTIGQILPKATAFILLPVYTYYLTPADYGIINSMQVLQTIFIIFFSFGIERSVNRLYYDYTTDEEKKTFFGTITLSVLIFSSFMVLMTFLFQNYISRVYSGIDFYPYYIYVIFTAFLNIFFILPKSYFRVNHKAGKFILLSLAQFLASTSLVLWFLIYQESGADGVLLGRLLGLVILLPFIIYILQKISSFTIKWSILKDSLKFSLPMMITLLSSWILNVSDRIFIENYFNLHEVGIYSLSYKISEVTLVLVAGFNSAYEPVFYQTATQSAYEVAKEKLFKYNRILMLAIIICVFGIVFYSKEIIEIMDARYSNSYLLIPIISSGILFAQLSSVFNRSIYQKKKSLLMGILTLSSAAINIGLNFILIPRYGGYGAAYSTLITFSVYFFIKYFYMKKIFYIPVDWKTLIPVVIILGSLCYLFIYVFEFELWFGIIIKTIIVFLLVVAFYLIYKDQIKLFINKKRN